MKRKILAMLLSFLLLFSLTGCNEVVKVNVDNPEKLASDELAEFVKISAGLCYDTATRIVYFTGVYIFTPYYAPNGLPYRYNPETNTLEEIE